MKYVSLCLLIGFLGFMASAYGAFQVASHQVAMVRDDLSDLTTKGEYQHEERIRNTFLSTFFLTFGAGVAVTLGSVVLILYVKNLEHTPP